MGRHSPPRSVHGSRERSPPRRRSGGDRGRKEHGSVTLLVRNIPRSCSNQSVRIAFERFGPIWNVYMPRFYPGHQPKGIAFVEFADASDASEAVLHMNNSMFDGRKITVIVSGEPQKRPEQMHRRDSARSNTDHEDRDTSCYGQSRSRTRSLRYVGHAERSHSRTCSPRYGGGARSRLQSPAPRRRDGDSVSPKRKEGHQVKSSTQSKEHDKDKKQRSCIPDNRNVHHDADNGSNESLATAKTDVEGSRLRRRSSRPSSESFSRRRDDYSDSPKRKEVGLAKSPRQSKEYDRYKKRMTYAPHYRNEHSPCKSPGPSSGSRSSRRDDHTTSPKRKRKRKEECLTKSPRQSKGHDRDKKRMQYGPDNRNDCRDGDSGHHEKRGDHSASAKAKEERQAKSSRLSKECDKDKKQRSYLPDNRNDHCDTDNRSKGRRETPDNSASSKRKKEPCQTESWKRSKEDEKPVKKNS